MDGTPAYGHVVVGVDGSPRSRQALVWAAREAALRRCPLDVVYGWQVKDEPRPPGEWGGVAPPVSAYQEQAQRKVEAVVAEVLPGGADCELTVHALHKPAGRAMLSFCGTADLLVVGGKQQGRLASWLVGSTSDDAVKNATCTVVVVRPPVEGVRPAPWCSVTVRHRCPDPTGAVLAAVEVGHDAVNRASPPACERSVMTAEPVHPAILGVGAHRPARSVTNDEVAGPIGSSDEWIVARSGIRARRFAAPDESLADMAVSAAGKALGEAGVPPAEVSLVLVTTMSNLRQAPPLSAEVAYRAGTDGAAALDTGAGCAGFCYTLAVAADAVRAGSARYAVVVGVERMTDIVDPTDRGTAFLFGDGAGAVVVGPAAEPGIGPVRWGSDGSRLGAIAQPYSWGAVKADPSTPAPTLRMAGQEVFRWAVTALAPVAVDAVRAAGLTLADIDVFVPHQANMRITDALVKGIGLRDGVVVAREVADVGNTSAASIPLAMEQLLSSGQARSGQRALLFGFGSGLLHAGQVVRLP